MTHTNNKIPPLFTYRRGTSCIHRLPARVTLVLLCVISVRAFVSTYGGVTYTAASAPVWIHAAVYAAITVVLFVLSGTPVSRLKNLLFVPVAGLLVTLVRSVDVFPLCFIPGEIPEGLLYTVRFLITTGAALVIFETTSRTEIQRAFERIQNGIGVVLPVIRRIPLAVTISIVLDFIPEIFFKWRMIQTATAARTPDEKKISVMRRLQIMTMEL